MANPPLKTGEKVVIGLSVLLLILALAVGAYVSRKAKNPPKDYFIESPMANAGMTLARKEGCNQCHLFMKNGEFGVAPVLEGEGTKRTKEWIIAYINDPKSKIENTRHNGKELTDFSNYTPEQKQQLIEFLFAMKSNPGSSNYVAPPTGKGH